MFCSSGTLTDVQLPEAQHLHLTSAVEPLLSVNV